MSNSKSNKSFINKAGTVLLQSTVLVFSLSFQLTRVLIKTALTQAMFGFAIKSTMSFFA